MPGIDPISKLPTDKDGRVCWREECMDALHEQTDIEPIEVNLQTLREDMDPNFPEAPFAKKPKIDGGSRYGHIKSVEAPQEYVADMADQREQSEDTGQHYRFVHRASITPEAARQGYVEVKLDPFRIAAIYKMTDFPLQTILKKTLCAGNRGHNDLREDLRDIICAAKRKLEMLDEDEQLTKKEEP